MTLVCLVMHGRAMNGAIGRLDVGDSIASRRIHPGLISVYTEPAGANRHHHEWRRHLCGFHVLSAPSWPAWPSLRFPLDQAFQPRPGASEDLDGFTDDTSSVLTRLPV